MPVNPISINLQVSLMVVFTRYTSQLERPSQARRRNGTLPLVGLALASVTLSSSPGIAVILPRYLGHRYCYSAIGLTNLYGPAL